MYVATYYINLASTISSITENFQLGFGSFVDKQRVPYISVETARSIYVTVRDCKSQPSGCIKIP